MKEQFSNKLRLRKANVAKLSVINDIIEGYIADGYVITLRQLYYRLVTRNIIPNVIREYQKLSNLLKKGRMAGVVDWAAIEDRTRTPYLQYWARDKEDAINDTVKQYKLNRQRNQENYVELWCEKDALSNVLKRKTDHYHIYLMVNRGYSSVSAMYQAYQRLARAKNEGKFNHILYLGDHDPSGLDMIRDIRDRMAEFGLHPDVKHIALTGEQIEEYDPPPNPTKFKDPRAKWYINEFGKTCWEVDALPPDVLHELVEDYVENLIDIDLFEETMEEEEKDRAELAKVAKRFAASERRKRK